MGQQHQQIQNTGKQEDILDECPLSQPSRGVVVGTYIYQEMISPNSLLRSDRFARSRSAIVAGEQEEMGRKKAANSSDSGVCKEKVSRMIKAANTHRRDTPTARAGSGFNKVRKRGKAPSKVRPMTAGTTKVRTLAQIQGGQQNGENYLRACPATTPSPQKNSGGFFSDIPVFQTDSSALAHKLHRGQVSPSGGSGHPHRAQLSQSPLRPDFSPIRSKAALKRLSPDQMARKISEPTHSSQLDEWSSRCFNLTRQIVEHLRSWDQSPLGGTKISTSPIMSRSYYSFNT